MTWASRSAMPSRRSACEQNDAAVTSDPSAIKGGSDLLALRRLTFLGHENTVQTITDVLGETPIKRCDLTLVGGSKCIQYGTPPGTSDIDNQAFFGLVVPRGSTAAKSGTLLLLLCVCSNRAAWVSSLARFDFFV
jgi:hypothetical protein